MGDGRLFWRAAGDLGNVTADADGTARLAFEEPLVSLREGDQFYGVGHAIALHANADDFSQPDGNVGAVLAIGTLQLK